jgi:two-component system, NarL family, response regulator YdfI
MEPSIQLDNSQIRVLVRAHSVVMQAGLESLLAAYPVLEVVRNFRPLPLPQQVEQTQPDVVVLEWDESDVEALALLSLTSEEEEIDLAQLEIVALIEVGSEEAIAALLQRGVRGIVSVDASADEIASAVQAVAAGLVVLSPDLMTRFLQPRLPSLSSTESLIALTTREVEVLRMIAEGLGNKAIARRLSISEHTVKFHIGSIFSKLNATSRTEAVILGARQGLILI